MIDRTDYVMDAVIDPKMSKEYDTSHDTQVNLLAVFLISSSDG